MNNYNTEMDNLVPITELAESVNFTPNKKDFDEKDYIEVEYIEAFKLFSSSDFQRLINQIFIRGAKVFKPYLVRPLYVFERPDGKLSVADGQHETILGILYTNKGSKIKMPCQVHIHPKNFTLQECLESEASVFKDLNFNRTNATIIARLRADIALNDPLALKTESQLDDMGVHIEGIGNAEGVEVSGYRKLMEAYNEYGLENVCKAIDLYQTNQKNKLSTFWNDVDKPLVGGLIAGLAALYNLLPFLGRGDKNYALTFYIDNFLKNEKPLGKKSLMSDIGGDSQSILFARRVVASCNTLVMHKIIRKKNGGLLQVNIEEDIMVKAGLGDPSDPNHKK